MKYYLDCQTLWLTNFIKYFFLQPFDTRDLDIYDKKQCKVLYKNVKDSVEDGLQVIKIFFIDVFMFRIWLTKISIYIN